MAHVKKRVRTSPNGDGQAVRTVTYQAVWREHAHGRDRTRSFQRRDDAERFLVDLQHRLLIGTYADPVLGRTPFRDAADRYLALGVWRPRTRQSATEKLRYAVEHFGARPIATIRKGDVQTFISGLAQGLAPNTVRIVRQHLTATFEVAIDDRLIAVNPCKGVRVPRADSHQVIPLTANETRAMMDAAHPWFRAAIVIGAGLGLRQSEAAGLTVDRIDFLRRTVRVDRQWQQSSGNTTGGFAPPKTGASVRVIPASPWVLDELAAHVARYGVGRDSVVVHQNGRPVDAARWGHYVRSARANAGLPSAVSYHDLRHFFASALIAAGCTIKQVQAALGHESAKVTLDTYGHLWPGDEDRVRDAVQRLSFGTREGAGGR